MLELANAIQEKIGQLEAGSISEEELNLTLEETRTLYDRLVVVQYKAFEKSVKGEAPVEDAVAPVAEPKPEKVETPAESEPEPEPENDLFGGFKFTLNTKEDKENELKSSPGNTQKPPKTTPKITPGKQESIPMPEQPLPFNNPNPPKSVESAPVEPVKEEEPAAAAENQINIIDQIDEAPTPKSLNDQLAANQSGDNLAKKLAMQPIDNLKTSIGINQKFLFMNDLFKGEHMDFHAVIDRIDAMTESEEAMTYLVQLREQYNWDMESESALNFTELVERRFL